MFFYDDTLTQWDASEIRSISPARKEIRKGAERWVHDIEFKDGQKLTILDVIYNNILRVPLHVWPAAPGYQALVGFDEDEVFLEPIVAWAITKGSSVNPVTLGGVNSGQDGIVPIVHPDGKVKLEDGPTYGSVGEYLGRTSTQK
ncbi:MAG TPA: hypothetical protein VMG08_18855 [Allosphingosinicella sp.]|nr:hypothetical protein [Allosphingosinicella sp.]